MFSLRKMNAPDRQKKIKDYDLKSGGLKSPGVVVLSFDGEEKEKGKTDYENKVQMILCKPLVI